MKTLSRLFVFLLLLHQSFAQVTVLVNDFPVSDAANTSVYRPAVASAPNGSYAVTWGDERFGNTNRASGAGNIFGRIVGSNGVPMTANFRVDDVVANTYYTDYWVFFSSPLFLPSGQLVVVWHVNGVSGPTGIQSNDVYLYCIQRNNRSSYWSRRSIEQGWDVDWRPRRQAECFLSSPLHFSRRVRILQKWQQYRRNACRHQQWRIAWRRIRDE